MFHLPSESPSLSVGRLGAGRVGVSLALLLLFLFSGLGAVGTGCAAFSSVRGQGLDDPQSSLAAASTATSAVAGTDFDIEDQMAAEIEASTDEEDEEAGMGVRPVLTVTGTVTYDIPMSDDPAVDRWVDYLTGRGRHWYHRWLERSTRYVPLFWSILEKYDLPKDLIFLSMIESGFSPRAFSLARAAGPWQFMELTARDYGLKVGYWVDERRDFEKSTDAAARYLKVLYRQFGDWHLAMAAYNAGARRIQRAQRSSRRQDFWSLTRSWGLRRETKQYVPKLLAAARVGKQSYRYGFDDVAYMAPFDWEVLSVTVATDLKTIARACSRPNQKELRQKEIRPEELKELNPALRFEITPPGTTYDVRVPRGAAASCSEGLAEIPADQRVTYRYHRLEPGETLALLAEKQGTTVDALVELNHLGPDDVDSVSDLVLPVALRDAATWAVEEPRLVRTRDRYRPPGLKRVEHLVRSGESLWTIARRYRVQVRMLKLWNGLWKKSGLRAGQRIFVYLSPSASPRVSSSSTAARSPALSRATATAVRASKPSVSASATASSSSRHRVTSGESLWIIAQRYGTTVGRLLSFNRLVANDPIQPGQILRIPRD